MYYNMKPVIIAIVGPSGCGKTTAAEHIEKEFGIPTIVSFTTRPMRPGETQGREHQFVSDDQVPARETMLAYTFFGGYHYWASHEQIPENGACTYVIDEKGLLMLQEKYGDRYELFTILVKMGKHNLHADHTRINRDKERVKIKDSSYNLIIHNNSTLQVFLAIVSSCISHEIKYNPIFKNIRNHGNN